MFNSEQNHDKLIQSSCHIAASHLTQYPIVNSCHTTSLSVQVDVYTIKFHVYLKRQWHDWRCYNVEVGKATTNKPTDISSELHCWNQRWSLGTSYTLIPTFSLLLQIMQMHPQQVSFGNTLTCLWHNLHTTQQYNYSTILHAVQLIFVTSSSVQQTTEWVRLPSQ